MKPCNASSLSFCFRAGLSLLLFAALAAAGLVPGAQAQSDDRPSSLLNMGSSPEARTLFKTDGYMVGGQYWTTVKPLNSEDSALPGALGGTEPTMLVGSTSGLRNPNGLWPSSYRFTQNFRNSLSISFPMFKADGWPGYSEGNPLFGADGSQDTGGENGTGRFLLAAYSDTIAGADDPSRQYTRAPRYTDRTRTHLVYEAGFPTVTGVDIRLRAHQFTPNTQNLNDFMVLEVTMENTGEPDTDADGEVDATGVTVDGVTMDVGATPTPSIRFNNGGNRDGNGYEGGGARVFGYVATEDSAGSPYNLYTYWKGTPGREGQTAPPEGERNMGINFTGGRGGYTDIWNGWQFMGVKQGGIPDGDVDTRSAMSYPSQVDASSPDKETLFGTHPIGEGAQKGWYTSSQWRSPLGGGGSDLAFWDATATWYEDYGKTSASRAKINLAPNSNFFSGGQPVDITTFQPGAGGRPNGDYKYASEASGITGINQPIWEPAWNPEAPEGDFFGGKGYTRGYQFTEAVGQGVGPFRLEPGEEITIVWAVAAGYRFEGVADAVTAANWAWERGWDIRTDLPVPATPDMNVESTNNQSARILWTDVSGVGGAEVDGYKIWRAAQFARSQYIEEGMRSMDRYQQQHQVDADSSRLNELKDPVNPFFSVSEGFFDGPIDDYQPAGWGNYDLIGKIPADELGDFAADNPNYQYAFEDTTAITGFTYWYYVSAYNDGDFTGPRGDVGGHIETSDMNRNGRNAPDASRGELARGVQWTGTFPFAFNNQFFPDENTLGYKNIGASFTVVPPTSSPDEAAEAITVSPNPYKRTSLNDVRSNAASHNINFLNMPEDFTLTIIDVSGQIVFQTTVEGANNGQYTWNMFSKDGVEVASGLYIYHVQYGDGQTTTGHFAIMR